MRALPLKPPRIADIAALAGVGTATVDRVLNGRAHVRESTRQRVLQAKERLEAGEAPGPRGRPWRLKTFLPRDAGPSTEFLARSFREVAAEGDAIVDCEFSARLEPTALARKLRACRGQRVDAVAFQALEHPRVASAVADLAACGIPCLALLSGMETAPLAGFVGVNNRAAGRTAGLLAGRMTTTPGRIAIVSGGQLYRAHEDREIGFRAIVRAEFAHVEVAGTFCGEDDAARNEKVTAAILRRHPDLVAIYKVGGGNAGIVRALKEAGLEREITVVGHNLTPETRAFLLDGSLDAVIHQNMRTAARETVRVLAARLAGTPVTPALLPVEIVTRENTEGQTFG